MLAFTSPALLAAPASLQPAAVPKVTKDEAAVDLKSAEYEITFTDKVFHIGANKAGTTSMWLFYKDLPGDWNPCHDLCGPKNKQWTDVHKKSDPVLADHRVFMDNGDVSDFKWLYETFPHSRFVMNVRKMEDWVVSRYDMVREIRLGGGCSAQGTHDDCKGGWYKECAPQPIFPGGHSCLKSWITWTGNSDDDLKGWVMGLAQVQGEQMEFFKQSEEHMNRFVQADFTDDSLTEDSIQRLWWINRKSLDTHRAKHIMSLDRELPTKPPLKALVGPHDIPHMLSDSHPSSTISHVRKLFKHAGCKEEHFSSVLYHHCAMEMLKNKVSFIETPNVTFPSAHHYFIHNDQLQSALDSGTVKWADDEIKGASLPLSASPSPTA
jgi:hypothetical protein